MTQSNIQFIQFSPEQLKEIISECIKGELSELSKELGIKESSQIVFTRKQTAKILGIDLSTLWSWTKNHKIQSYGISNRVYYKYQDIQDSLVALNPSTDINSKG